MKKLRNLFIFVNKHQLKSIMPTIKKSIFAILIATIWISISEFVRNTFILHKYWVNHYNDLGLIFPEEPINGAVWGIWSLCFAIAIFIVAQKFSFWQTVLLSWFVGFAFMWLVIGNLGVLPFSILPIAIPLSLLEVVIATYIINKIVK